MNKIMYSAEEVNQILFEITLDTAKVEEKLKKIEQIVNEKGNIWGANVHERLKEILDQE